MRTCFFTIFDNQKLKIMKQTISFTFIGAVVIIFLFFFTVDRCSEKNTPTNKKKYQGLITTHATLKPNDWHKVHVGVGEEISWNVPGKVLYKLCISCKSEKGYRGIKFDNVTHFYITSADTVKELIVTRK